VSLWHAFFLGKMYGLTTKLCFDRTTMFWITVKFNIMLKVRPFYFSSINLNSQLYILHSSYPDTNTS
jgi:hypothetical protein